MVQYSNVCSSPQGVSKGIDGGETTNFQLSLLIITPATIIPAQPQSDLLYKTVSSHIMEKKRFRSKKSGTNSPPQKAQTPVLFASKQTLPFFLFLPNLFLRRVMCRRHGLPRVTALGGGRTALPSLSLFLSLQGPGGGRLQVGRRILFSVAYCSLNFRFTQKQNIGQAQQQDLQ